MLTWTRVPEPEVGPRDVLIRTAASTVNPVDTLTRSGALAEHASFAPPTVPGWDVSGVVAAVGARVSHLGEGDPVVAMTAHMATGRGTYAELVALDADIVAPAPASVPLERAAALPLAGLTAHQALEVLAPAAGSSLLITGAVGAVGGFGVQLARAAGLRVLAHVRTEGDAEHARALGADEVFVAGPPPSGVADALFETAGLPEYVGAVRDGGRAVSVVATHPPAAERGVEVRMSFVEQDGRRLAALAELVDAGALTLRVDRVLPLSEAAKAHTLFEAGGTRGKILLTADGSA
ncbi:NADP-dependent oxidoreductase [Nocardiopsis sp. FIRDI 009]|uniref:NADP-dependent oxidoreductase n=1 Tax=Nocardiopsis sp. FIRDI 009 TaxID=714197 RepID=UPI0018E58D04|nr:NADP-dependent oxidoreductase [Nocardiopsis sp. FIRDI 009]